MTKTNATNYRARNLTRPQVVAIRLNRTHGARIVDLAEAYGVSRRTIYRALERATVPVHRVEVAGWFADFEIIEDGPIRVTPWLHGPEEGAST